MRRKRMAGIAVLVTVLLGAVASGAWAAPKRLDIYEQGGFGLNPGDALALTAPFGGVSLKEAKGRVLADECLETAVEGSDVTNNEAKDVLQLVPPYVRCLWTDPALGPENFIGFRSWKLTLSAAGKAEITGGAGNPTVVLDVEQSGPPFHTCEYQAPKLKGTFPVGSTNQPLHVTFANQKLTGSPGGVCPSPVHLTMDFPVAEGFLDNEWTLRAYSF